MKDAEFDGSDELNLPVWAREEAFPPAAEGFGWVDRKGHRHVSGSLDELATTIREDKDSVVNLVWTPDSLHCRVPEEIAAFEEPIAVVRKRWAKDDLADSVHRLKWFGFGVLGLIAYMAFQAWRILDVRGTASGIEPSLYAGLRYIFHAIKHSSSVGLALLGFLIFAFIPWYQAQKRMREMNREGAKSAPSIPLIRFETWLEIQKAPVTWAIMVTISIVFIAQFFFKTSVEEAGLVKVAYRAGEYWRLLTAPMLHGGLIHFIMNVLGLLYLGKRMEVFARWPHVPMVFLFSALLGGEASARFTDATSVGASGGLMGWLGFLLVFETLHSKLVPRSAKRRLIGGVIITGLIGLVGYKFIDNAAHFGGMFAGMAYALIVFPKSTSVIRPSMTLTDRILGTASLAVIALSGLLAILKITG